MSASNIFGKYAPEPAGFAPQAPALPGSTAASAAVVAGSDEGTPLLDAEKLVAYQLALELQVMASGLVPAQHRIIKDQLERASMSVVLQVAEGAGRHSRRQKRYFYSIARGSASEVAAIMDVLRLRRLASQQECARVRSLAVRVVQLLTKLHAALG